MTKLKDFDKEKNDVRLYPKSGILIKHSDLSPIELVLLAARRCKELREEGITDDNGVKALKDFEDNPEQINQTRERLIDSLRKNLPEEIDDVSKD